MYGLWTTFSLLAQLTASDCEAGDNRACVHVGDVFSAKKDYVFAAQLYTKACDRGDGAACQQLALLYEKGKGVPKDKKRADELRSKVQVSTLVLLDQQLGIRDDIWMRYWELDSRAPRFEILIDGRSYGTGGDGDVTVEPGAHTMTVVPRGAMGRRAGSRRVPGGYTLESWNYFWAGRKSAELVFTTSPQGKYVFVWADKLKPGKDEGVPIASYRVAVKSGGTTLAEGDIDYVNCLSDQYPGAPADELCGQPVPDVGAKK